MDPVDPVVSSIQRTVIEEKDLCSKTENLFLRLKIHFNHLKEELTAQSINFNDSSQIPTLLSLCFTNDSGQFKTQSQDIKEIKRKNLQAAEICLKVILSYFENSEIVEAKKSIIHISLQSLYVAYSHCRDSEAFYGESFEEFTDELASFYKLIQDVQRAALKCLDGVINSKSYDTELESTEITLISSVVGKLCELVSSLDRMSSVIFWKTFIKLIYKFKSIAQKKVEVDSFLMALILDINDIVYRCQYCIETKEEVDESEVKMGIIELSTLKKIFDVFQGLLKEKVIKQILDLALQLNNLLILSHYLSVPESKNLYRIKILLKTAKPIITSFFSDNMFFTSAFRYSTEEVQTHLQLPLVLLKLTALDYLKTVSDSTLLLQIKALKELFETLKKNKLKDDFQLISLKIQEPSCKYTVSDSSELSTLFDYCYSCMTEYCKYMHSNNVTELCEDWLPSYTTSSDTVSLLIADVWIYYIRVGSVDNIYKNCEVLLKALKQSNSNARIELLLMRMLGFLPFNYKVTLLKENSLSQKLYHNNSVSRFGSSPMNFMPIILKSREKSKLILPNMDLSTSKNIQTLRKIICNILEFEALSINALTPLELLKILNFANIYLESNAFNIQMAICTVLRALKGRILSRNFEELEELKSVIVKLLCELMNSKNYIIKFEAFDVYFNLAQSTSHTDIIKQVVIQCSNLIPFVKSFAENVPPGGFLKEETREMYAKEQLLNYLKSNKTLPLK